MLTYAAATSSGLQTAGNKQAQSEHWWRLGKAVWMKHRKHMAGHNPKRV
jgi:hypothetical protein